LKFILFLTPSLPGAVPVRAPLRRQGPDYIQVLHSNIIFTAILPQITLPATHILSRGPMNHHIQRKFTMQPIAENLNDGFNKVN